MNNKMMILAVIGVFIAAAGTLHARGMARHGGGHSGGEGWHGKGGFGKKLSKRMLTHMRNTLSDKLDLSAEQEKKVQVIIEAKAEKTKALMEETREKALAIRNEGVSEIKSFLDKDQGQKLDRFAARMDRRREERRARWFGGDDD